MDFFWYHFNITIVIVVHIEYCNDPLLGLSKSSSESIITSGSVMIVDASLSFEFAMELVMNMIAKMVQMRNLIYVYNGNVGRINGNEH